MAKFLHIEDTILNIDLIEIVTVGEVEREQWAVVVETAESEYQTTASDKTTALMMLDMISEKIGAEVIE